MGMDSNRIWSIFEMPMAPKVQSRKGLLGPVGRYAVGPYRSERRRQRQRQRSV